MTAILVRLWLSLCVLGGVVSSLSMGIGLAIAAWEEVSKPPALEGEIARRHFERMPDALQLEVSELVDRGASPREAATKILRRHRDEKVPSIADAHDRGRALADAYFAPREAGAPSLDEARGIAMEQETKAAAAAYDSMTSGDREIIRSRIKAGGERVEVVMNFIRSETARREDARRDLDELDDKRPIVLATAAAAGGGAGGIFGAAAFWFFLFRFGRWLATGVWRKPP